MIEDNTYTKMPGFLKNPFYGQMGNSGLSMAKRYTRLYPTICLNNFFKTLQYDRGQYLDKNQLSKISPKILSWAKWTVFLELLPKILMAYVSQSALRIFFQTLQHDEQI